MDHLGPRPSPETEGDDLAFERATLVLGFGLLALAGWIDGAGFVRWSGLYVSFMSGNTAQLGATLAVADWHGMGEAGRTLLMFVVGVICGELVAHRAGRWRSPAVVAVETALLWLAAASTIEGWGDGVTASVAGLAMGVQTAAVHKADGVSVALTYVTGTLVNAGRAIAAALRGAEPWGKTLPFAGFWVSLCGGALAGAGATLAGLDVAMVSAAGIGSLLAVYAGVLAGRRTTH